MNPSAISARSEFVSDHPLRLAQEIAKLLDSDPIAAGQVKEHLPANRLGELLRLSKGDVYQEPETIADLFDDSPFTDEELLKFVIGRFGKTEILEALNSP